MHGERGAAASMGAGGSKGTIQECSGIGKHARGEGRYRTHGAGGNKGTTLERSGYGEHARVGRRRQDNGRQQQANHTRVQTGGMHNRVPPPAWGPTAAREPYESAVAVGSMHKRGAADSTRAGNNKGKKRARDPGSMHEK